MKFEIEITEDELKLAIIEKLANDMAWRWPQEKKDKFMDKVDWSKMGPHIQEAILKMAAKNLFK